MSARLIMQQEQRQRPKCKRLCDRERWNRIRELPDREENLEQLRVNLKMKHASANP